MTPNAVVLKHRSMCSVPLYTVEIFRMALISDLHRECRCKLDCYQPAADTDIGDVSPSLPPYLERLARFANGSLGM